MNTMKMEATVVKMKHDATDVKCFGAYFNFI